MKTVICEALPRAGGRIGDEVTEQDDTVDISALHVARDVADDPGFRVGRIHPALGGIGAQGRAHVPHDRELYGTSRGNLPAVVREEVVGGEQGRVDGRTGEQERE